MRILITGGCGYLGSNLAIYLSNFGHKIILGTRKKEFLQIGCQVQKLFILIGIVMKVYLKLVKELIKLFMQQG